MKKIVILFSLFIVIIIHTTALAQQPQPIPDPEMTDPPRGILTNLLFNNHFRIGGVEGSASTFGYGLGLPVFWVQDQMKIVPMAGWFWDTLPGWSDREAVGGKVLWYFKKQRQVLPGEVNVYTGISSLAGADIEHHTGIAVGMEPFFNRYLKLGVEVQLGLRSARGADRVYGGVGVVVGFGW